MYQFGDTFTVSGTAVFMDNEDSSSFINTTLILSNQVRDNCKTLSGDLTKIIIEYERADQVPDCMITCSGCTGSLRLEHSRKLILDQDNVEGNIEDISALINTLHNFPFFRNIDKKSLNEIVKFSTLQSFEKNNIILRKGDPGTNFYIIVSGKVDVLNETGITISTLGRGDVFGEMSLICEENVGATIQAAEPTELLNIDHKHFKNILNTYPALQGFFTRLMAQRLSRSNKIRSEDYASGMIGKLEEIPPEALFQTLNVNSKTGILTITQLSEGTARFSMRQGALIKASYGNKKGKEAFYDILREKKGRFKFTPGLPPEDFDAAEIGFFMKLLMVGLQKAEQAGKE